MHARIEPSNANKLSINFLFHYEFIYKVIVILDLLFYIFAAYFVSLILYF